MSDKYLLKSIKKHVVSWDSGEIGAVDAIIIIREILVGAGELEETAPGPAFAPMKTSNAGTLCLDAVGTAPEDVLAPVQKELRCAQRTCKSRLDPDEGYVVRGEDTYCLMCWVSEAVSYHSRHEKVVARLQDIIGKHEVGDTVVPRYCAWGADQ